MRFTKYDKYGGYHWKWYNNPTKHKRYKGHVDRVKEWIKEKGILDIGCGDGLITFILKAKGIDNEPVAIRVGKRRGADIMLGDAYAIPYKNEEFDAVFMGDTLEHLEFPEKALKEARRVLKKCIYIVVPKNEVNDTTFHQHWTSEKLKALVEKQGFKLEGGIEESQTIHPKIYAKFQKT